VELILISIDFYYENLNSISPSSVELERVFSRCGLWKNCNCYHYLINGIQRVQNRAIKNLFGFPFLEQTYDIHKRCAIFPIALLHFKRSTSLLHNVYKSFTLSNISQRENFQFHYHNLRNRADIRNETTIQLVLVPFHCYTHTSLIITALQGS
jgi:hypothetical protein